MTYVMEGTYFHAILIFIITTHAVEITCIKCQYQQFSTRNQHTIHVRYFTNALPDDIKQLKSVHKFKLKVKSFLLQTVSIQLETILIVKKKNNV